MGIQEKKKIREIQEMLDAEGLPKLRSSCGNEALTVDLLVNESLEADTIRISQSNVADFIEGFQKICEDSDYREEIAKISTVKICIEPEVTRHAKHFVHGEISLEGETLCVKVDGEHSLSNGNGDTVPKLIMDLY